MSQSPGQLDLCITKGLTFGPVTFTLQTALEVAVDITGWSVSAEAQGVQYGHKFDLLPVITDATNGVITMYMTDEQTALLNPADYTWDMLFENDSGEKLGVYIEGSLSLGTSVTTP